MNWELIKDIAIIFIPCVIVLCAAYYFKNKYRDAQDKKERKDELYWIEQREKILFERYSNFIAYWLERFEHETAELTGIVKVKDFLYDEYDVLCHSKEKDSQKIPFDGRLCDVVVPFVGVDCYFYAICIEEVLDSYEYRVSLVPYAKDKFMNKNIKPVMYDNLYYPPYFFDLGWKIKKCYSDAEVVTE